MRSVRSVAWRVADLVVTMKTNFFAFAVVLVLCALAACKSPPQYHPWGVGSSAYWDNVKKGF